MIELTFTFDRDTKNARRFNENLNGRERGVVGTLYVLKSDLEKAFGTLPVAIAVTIGPEGV